MLTGNNDVNRKILNELEDKDLVNVCQTNKQAETLCNDQTFWKLRVFNRFGYVGGDVLMKYKGKRSWSEYYIHDLRQFKIFHDKNLLRFIGNRDGKIDMVTVAEHEGAWKHLINMNDIPVYNHELRDIFGNNYGRLCQSNYNPLSLNDVQKNILVEQDLLDNNPDILVYPNPNTHEDSYITCPIGWKLVIKLGGYPCCVKDSEYN